MKIFGYEKSDKEIDVGDSKELAEITISASPSELQTIARFLLGASNSMIEMGSKFDHVHLADKFKEFGCSPHFVVFRSDE